MKNVGCVSSVSAGDALVCLYQLLHAPEVTVNSNCNSRWLETVPPRAAHHSSISLLLLIPRCQPLSKEVALPLTRRAEEEGGVQHLDDSHCALVNVECPHHVTDSPVQDCVEGFVDDNKFIILIFATLKVYFDPIAAVKIRLTALLPASVSDILQRLQQNVFLGAIRLIVWHL